MPLMVAQRQQAVVSHRMNFLGRPSGPSTVSWQYKGRPWEVVRPDDGLPAERRSVQCAVCRETLTFKVHSVAATRQRQAVWRAAVWACSVIFLAGAVGVITGLGSDSNGFIVLGIVAMVLGFVIWWPTGAGADAEDGVTGHGNGWPGSMPKHQITLAEPHPEAMPELVCTRCGHQEEYFWGSHFRKSFVQKQYQAARVRFEQHTCP